MGNKNHAQGHQRDYLRWIHAWANRIYELSGQCGKRPIVNGGAKNSIVVMPNAPIYATRSPIESSFFGNAGQRCLAGSNLIPVGKETPHNLLRKFVQKARQMCVGYGLEPTTEIGPVITEKAKNRILGNIKGGTQNKQSYFWMEGIRMSLDIQTVSTWDQRFSITYPEI